MSAQTAQALVNPVQLPNNVVSSPMVQSPVMPTFTNSQPLPTASSPKRPPPTAQPKQASQPTAKRQKTITDDISLSEKNQRLFEQQPLHIQVKYRVAAFFQAYSSSVSELVKKFVSLVLSINIDKSGTADIPEAFAVAFEIANEKAPTYFWIGLRLQALLLARIRNWLTAMIKNKKYDGTQPCLQGLSNMSLTEEHLERYKLNKVLTLLIKRGDAKIQEICNHILNRATQLTKLNSAARPEVVRPKGGSSSVKATPIKTVVSKPQHERSPKVELATNVDKPANKGSPPAPKPVKPVKPAPPVVTVKKSAPAGNSFFKSLQTPKPNVSSSTSSPPLKTDNKQASKPVVTSKPSAPVLSFSSHLKSIRESKKKDLERKVKAVEPVVKKSKKSVRWRDDDLTETREYYLDPEERAEKKIKIQGNAKGLEYREAVTGFWGSSNELEQEEEIEWYSPKSIDLSNSSISSQMLEQYPVKRGGLKETQSKEAQIQKNREAHTLIAMYMDASEIPDSPAEPDQPEASGDAEPKEIPLANGWKHNPLFKNLLSNESKDSFDPHSQPKPEVNPMLPNQLTSLLSSLASNPAFSNTFNNGGNNTNGNNNFNNTENTYNNYDPPPSLLSQSGNPVSQPTLTPELLSQLTNLKNVLNLNSNGINNNFNNNFNNGSNNFNNGNNNNYNSNFNNKNNTYNNNFNNSNNYNYSNNNYGSNNNNFNNENQQYQNKRFVPPKILALRQQDVRESVRNDTSTLDKWKFPCMFYSKHCGNGDGCYFIHLSSDTPK
jgi:hypothetical protein